jgi:hypothetical protein
MATKHGFSPSIFEELSRLIQEGDSRQAVVFMVKAIEEYTNTPTTESIALPEKHEGPVIKFLLQDHQAVTHSRRRLPQLLNDAPHTSYSSFSSTISDPRSPFVEKCTCENTRRTSARP